MQIADGPDCKNQFLRTTSSHSWDFNDEMDYDQLYVEVYAEDWPRLGTPRGPNRRFFHVAAQEAILGADCGGIQPGNLDANTGKNYRKEVNYTLHQMLQPYWPQHGGS